VANPESWSKSSKHLNVILSGSHSFCTWQHRHDLRQQGVIGYLLSVLFINGDKNTLTIGCQNPSLLLFICEFNLLFRGIESETQVD